MKTFNVKMIHHEICVDFSLLFLDKGHDSNIPQELHSKPVHALRVQSVHELLVALKDFASQAQLTLSSEDWDHKHVSQSVSSITRSLEWKDFRGKPWIPSPPSAMFHLMNPVLGDKP